jgi:phosphoribosyl 1,2-cyclic phosphate phosphodiesterase
MSIGEAIAVAQQIGAPRTFLTHLTHSTDHGPAEAALPVGVKFAYDGLRVSL